MKKLPRAIILLLNSKINLKTKVIESWWNGSSGRVPRVHPHYCQKKGKESLPYLNAIIIIIIFFF
jgi:hypothetical protein